MKKIILFLFFILTIHIECESQIIKIKKEVKELFYELSMPTTKYDARKLLHSSDNFSDINEFSFKETDLIIVNFNENYKLSFLKNATRKSMQFDFKKGTDENSAVTITLYYPNTSADNCSKQFQEMINYYKPISFKTKIAPIIVDSTKRGDIFYAYSSDKSFKKYNSYIIIDTQYVENGGGNIGLSPSGYYSLSVTFYPFYFY